MDGLVFVVGGERGRGTGFLPSDTGEGEEEVEEGVVGRPCGLSRRTTASIGGNSGRWLWDTYRGRPTSASARGSRRVEGAYPSMGGRSVTSLLPSLPVIDKGPRGSLGDPCKGNCVK